MVISLVILDFPEIVSTLICSEIGYPRGPTYEGVWIFKRIDIFKKRGLRFSRSAYEEYRIYRNGCPIYPQVDLDFNFFFFTKLQGLNRFGFPEEYISG